MENNKLSDKDIIIICHQYAELLLKRAFSPFYDLMTNDLKEHYDHDINNLIKDYEIMLKSMSFIEDTLHISKTINEEGGIVVSPIGDCVDCSIFIEGACLEHIYDESGDPIEDDNGYFITSNNIAEETKFCGIDFTLEKINDFFYIKYLFIGG